MSQISISQLPERRQEKAMHSCDRASQQYPSVLVEGYLVHVCHHDGDWEVWVNCEDADFTGLCVAVGATRDEAVAEAVRTLEAVVAHLQQPRRS